MKQFHNYRRKQFSQPYSEFKKRGQFGFLVSLLPIWGHRAVLANFSSSTCQFWGFSRKKASSFVDEKFFYDLPLSLLGIYSVITARNFPPPPPLPKNLLDFSFKPKSTGIIIFILYSNDTKANLLKLVQCRKQIGKKNYSVVEGKMQFPTTPHILFFFSKYFPILKWNQNEVRILLRERQF